MAAPRLEHDRGPVLCEYYVVCQSEATGTVLDTSAGAVPTCVRCAHLAGVHLRTGGSRAALPHQRFQPWPR